MGRVCVVSLLALRDSYFIGSTCVCVCAVCVCVCVCVCVSERDWSERERAQGYWLLFAPGP